MGKKTLIISLPGFVPIWLRISADLKAYCMFIQTIYLYIERETEMRRDWERDRIRESDDEKE